MLVRAEALWRRTKSLSRQAYARSLATALIAVFSIVFLGGMLWYYSPTLAAYPWELSPLPLLAAGLFYILHLWLSVWGWILLLDQRGVRIPFRQHLKIYCMSRIAGRLPGAPWHLVGRAVGYRALGVGNGAIAIASGLEMVLVILSGVFVGLFVWFTLPAEVQTRLVWLAPVVAVILILIHPISLEWILKRLGQAEPTTHLRYRDVLAPLGIFTAGWAAGGIVLYMVILALYPLPLAALPGIVGAWALSGVASLLVFFSPSGFGVKEITLGLILVLFIPPALAIIVSILMRLLITFAEFAAALATSRL